MAKKKMRLIAITVSMGFMLVFLIVEIGLRISGVKPYRGEERSIILSPHSFIESDPVLGYKPRPGLYQSTYNFGLVSWSTHWPDNSRATRPDLNSHSGAPRIHIYGCSYSYGFNISDSMSMAWKMQEQMPDFDVRNYAFIGYGINQVYLSLKNHLENGIIPSVIVVNYASIHDERNVLTTNYKASLSLFSTQRALSELNSISWPAYGLNSSGELVLNYEDIIYEKRPLAQHSSIVRYIWHQRTLAEFRKTNAQMVSFKLLFAIYELAKKHGSRLVVTGIVGDNKTRQVLGRCREASIPTLDISVDYRNSVFTLHPYDPFHPSSLATSHFAKTIVEFLNP